MSFNILDEVRGYVTPELIGSAASFLGEPETSVSKALSGLVPVVLSGITQKAESAGGADLVFDLAKKAADSGITGNLSSNFISGGGGIPEGAPAMLQGVFGHLAGGPGNAIADFAGIRGASAASLLGSILPLALGLLGKHATENGLSAAGLLSMLKSQKGSIQQALPAGLTLPGSTVGSSEHHTRPAAPTHHYEEPKKSGSWLTPLLLGVLSVAFLLYLMKGCGAPKEEVQVEEQVVAPDTTKVPAAAAIPTEKITLADGTQIDARQGGFEHGLVACLNDAACIPGKGKWFDFDDINFDLGSAVITESSMRQIRNLVAVLKAYPKAKIKIGGYTDKTGDEAVNKKLSSDRATAVFEALKANGANEVQLLGAEGYGSEFAIIAREASEEERRPDRRISVSLREK